PDGQNTAIELPAISQAGRTLGTDRKTDESSRNDAFTLWIFDNDRLSVTAEGNQHHQSRTNRPDPSAHRENMRSWKIPSPGRLHKDSPTFALQFHRKPPSVVANCPQRTRLVK